MPIDFSQVQEIEIPEGKVQKIEYNGTVLWETPNIPFYIEMAENGSITLEYMRPYNQVYDPNDRNLQYSFNGKDWTSPTNTDLTLNLNSGDKIYLKNLSNNFYSSGNKFYVRTSYNFKIGGNIASLVNFNDTIHTNEFSDLFYYHQKLIDASKLTIPFETAPQKAYYRMFGNCTNLTLPPKIKTNYFGNESCNMMFRDSGITITPELNIKSVDTYSLWQCFYNCTSLLTSSNIRINCNTAYYYSFAEMFFNCSNMVSTLPSVNITNNIDPTCISMYYQCEKLTTAPQLPSTSLSNSCYANMFYSCHSLTEAPQLPATTLAVSCYYMMFYDCTSLTKPPTLQALIIPNWAYQNMFYKCYNLKVNTTSGTPFLLFTTKSGQYSAYGMFNDTGGSFTGEPNANTSYYYTQ